MESELFDKLVRGAYAGASRRGMLRVGVGALAASALAALGLRADDADAKKKKKKKITICENGQTLTVNKKKWQQKHPTATKGACLEPICPADQPITCGKGCCPSTYPKCCPGDIGNVGVAQVLADAFVPGEATCNPASFNCCPLDQGGGSCGGNEPKCCPATAQAPFGSCTETDAVCCTTEQGGFSCSADQPVCCLQDPSNIFGGRNCCPTGSNCCQVDADCPSNDCGGNGCCVAAPREAGRGAERTRQVGSERFHLEAR